MPVKKFVSNFSSYISPGYSIKFGMCDYVELGH